MGADHKHAIQLGPQATAWPHFEAGVWAIARGATHDDRAQAQSGHRTPAVCANVLMFVPGATDVEAGALAQLSQRVSGLAGVLRVRCGVKLPKALLIDYDARRISAAAILERARALGLPARLVGL